MITVDVPCTPILEFTDGVVTGKISVTPTGLLDAIFINTTLSFSCVERKSAMQIISQKKVQLSKSPDSYSDILLTSGTVTRDYVKMTLHQTMDLLVEYVDLDTLIESLNDDTLRTGEAMRIQDFVKLRDYVYACDDCNYMSETVKVKFE